MGSARSNRSAFSSRQKYCERNNSGRQMICAPLDGRFADALQRFRQVLVRVQRTGELCESYAKFVIFAGGHNHIVQRRL